MTSKEFLKQAEEELYAALQAIQDGDLPFARSSSTRAASRITEAHQASRQTPSNSPEPTMRTSNGVDKLIKDLTLTD